MKATTTTPCSFPGCDRAARARGYCTGHYVQAQRHGADKLRPLSDREPTKTRGVSVRLTDEQARKLAKHAKAAKVSDYAMASRLLVWALSVVDREGLAPKAAGK